MGVVVRELRERGGRVTLTAREAEARLDVDVATVVVRPADGPEARAYEEAQEAFKEVGVEQLTADQADELGARAAEQLRALSA